MTATFTRWLALLAIALPCLARAQAPDDSLYRQLGEQPGLVALVDELVADLLADPRTSPFFRDIDRGHFKKQLVDQLCEVSGGPCKLVGPDMKKAHAGIDVTKRDFNAVVEVLQRSMDTRGIPFSTQNRLLARLAPMHRDIVNTP